MNCCDIMYYYILLYYYYVSSYYYYMHCSLCLPAHMASIPLLHSVWTGNLPLILS